MNKKIGILNFHFSDHNYGAVLQAAALEFILKEKGYSAEHINYIPQNKIGFRRFIKRLIIKTGFISVSKERPVKNSNAFKLFRSKFITRSKRVSSPRQFYNISKHYDAIVVGSDQVWRPKMTTDPAAFFLFYAAGNVERISYAASFGAEEWEHDLQSEITKMAGKELKKFKAISCRETSGLEICKSIFGINASHVLDPLLLVSDNFFHPIISSANPSNKKLVYYKLDNEQEFLPALNMIELKFNLVAHNLYKREGIYDDEYEEVNQWVRNIFDADIVVSDSFHCICLAVRFNKRVYFYPNPKRGQARLDDLFEYLNLEKEYIGGNLWLIKRGRNYLRYLEKLRNNSYNFIDKLN